MTMTNMTLLIILFFLIVLSAFFSGSETGLMAINRYRIRHKSGKGDRVAMKIVKLLKRPDRILGVILIGNTFCNILAAAIATVVAVHYFGEYGVVMATILLTLVILIFAEVAPKTIGALYPERLSRWVVWPLSVLLTALYPLVILVNGVTNGLLKLFRIKVSARGTEPLTYEELKTVIHEASGRLPSPYHSMLLAILDLKGMTVEDAMVPRHEIQGINLHEPWKTVEKQILESEHDLLPIYHDNINNMVGILNRGDLVSVYQAREFDEKLILDVVKDPYFVPEGTPLNIQLLNFQQQKLRTALVVDEYGEIVGLITLEAILYEIVGEFAARVETEKLYQLEPDGSYLVDGTMLLREFNKISQMTLPLTGPKTISGLIIEYLETNPQGTP